MVTVEKPLFPHRHMPDERWSPLEKIQALSSVFAKECQCVFEQSDAPNDVIYDRNGIAKAPVDDRVFTWGELMGKFEPSRPPIYNRGDVYMNPRNGCKFIRGEFGFTVSPAWGSGRYVFFDEIIARAKFIFIGTVLQLAEDENWLPF